MIPSGKPAASGSWSNTLVDVSFHLAGKTYDFSQPLPHKLQAAIRHAVDNAAQLADLERVQVTLLSGATPCSFTMPATPALLTALRARRRAVAL